MRAFDEPDEIYGVDYSASRRGAGRNTWVAKGIPEGDDRLLVERLANAAEWPDGGKDRESTNRFLVELITDREDRLRAFGIDFPFGLPATLLGVDWQEFVSQVRDRDEWGELGEVRDPQTLYDYASTTDADLLRETDTNHGGQAPTGFRIKTQTYYGISVVLAPIAEDEDVSIVPMEEPRGATVVLETYPRAVFEGIGANGQGYKRDTRRSIERLRENVEALESAGVRLGDDAKSYAIATDDALDAVAAAYATWRATCVDGHPEEYPDSARQEGYIFA